MKIDRTWAALGTSISVHVALVAFLGIGLMQPPRIVNRIEVNLEGATLPGVSPGVVAPSPVAGPEMPGQSSMPAAAAVPVKLSMPTASAMAPTPTRFDPDGALPAVVGGGLPGPTKVALTATAGGGGGGGTGPGGGPGGPGVGSGPGTPGSGRGRHGGGSGSALSGYLYAIRARVDAAKRYPQMAQQRRQEGVVVVTFRLTVDGRLVGEPKVTRSSGYRQLDAAALRAVSKGVPYPRFPLDPALMKDIQIPVKFYLR